MTLPFAYSEPRSSLAGRLWNRLPFVGRLLVTASLALVVAAVAMLWVSARQEAEDVQAELRAELAKELDLLPATLADLVVVGDFAALQQALDRHVKRATLARIGFRDMTGVTLESTNPLGPVGAPAWFTTLFGFADVSGEMAVTVGGRDYGQLSLTLTVQARALRAWRRLLSHLGVLALAIGLDFLGIWWVLRSGLKPLARLEAGAGALAAGAYDTRLAPAGNPEFRHLIDAFNRMAEAVQISRLQLAESEQRLALALEGAALGLWDWHVPSGRVVFNARWAEIVGYRVDEIAPDVSAWQKLVHPDDWPGIQAALEPHLRGETAAYACEHRLLHKDGHWVWVLDAGRVLQRDAAGQPLRAVGIHLDISTAKATELALQAREQHLRTLIGAMDDVVFLVDTAGRLAECHWPASRDYPRPDPTAWLDRDYREVFPEAAAVIDQAITGLMADRQPRQVEMFLVPGGVRRHFQASFSALMDGGPWPRGFLCVARDVTADDERQAHNRLLVAALEAAANGIIITDSESVIQWANPAFTILTGYGRDEVIGRKPKDLINSGRQDRQFYQALWDTILSGQVWQGELVNRRKDGRLYHEELTITPVPGEDGAMRHFIAIKQDVTARKAMEEELRRLATTDFLTGIANRRHFMEQLGLELERGRRSGRPAALLMLDLDHFKAINDRHGHAAGDTVLRHFVLTVRDHLRQVDLFGRLGGEEFAILLTDIDPAGAADFADDLRRRVAASPARVASDAIAFTVSIGVAPVDAAAGAEALLQRADDALYRAKAAGRNRVEAAAA